MEKYNSEWFKERAFKSLKKLDNGIWDFSDSLLIYIGSGDAVYEQLQEEDTSYFKLVTKPEHEYLQLIAKNIADILPNNFEYIDLGPGTEHKEQFLFDELKKQGKTFTYVPVDISDHFLEMAESHAASQGIPVRKVKASFEELPEVLEGSTTPRFIFLTGLTFSNYAPQEILKLLGNIAGVDGFIFITNQMKDRINIIEMREMYQKMSVLILENKMRLVGLDPLIDISPIIVDDEFYFYCSIIKNNSNLESIGIRPGDKMVVLKSPRYTKESLESELAQYAHESFDTGSSFIGTIIRT